MTSPDPSVGQTERYEFGREYRDEMTGAAGKLAAVAYYVGRCELLLALPLAADGSWRSSQWINAAQCAPAGPLSRSTGFGVAPLPPGGEVEQ